MAKYFLVILYLAICTSSSAQTGKILTSVLKHDDEEVILAFNTKHNTAIICRQKQGKYLVYRFGTASKVDLQYPAVLDETSKEKFHYNKGKIIVLSFINNNVRYEIYEQSNPDALGINVTLNGKTIKFSGDLPTKIGSLITLNNEKGISHSALKLAGSKGNKWVGEWVRNDRMNGAELSFKKLNDNILQFELSASSGGNDGGINGNAIVNKNKAVFISKNEYGDCHIEFSLLKDNSIEINQLKGDCGAPMGVTYNGRFFRAGSNEGKTDETESLSQLGILTRSEDLVLKQIAGADYDLFTSSSQLTNTTEDLDNFDAKVQESGVRGLYTLLENIILTGADKKIWAAVIDNEKVNYYTNDPAYKNKLPKTIEKWCELFRSYPIIYKSK